MKAKGLPVLILIDEHPEFLGKMSLAMRAQFDVYPFQSTADALGELPRINTPALFQIGLNSLKEDGRKFVQVREQNDILRRIPLICFGKEDKDSFHHQFVLSGKVGYLQVPFLKSQLINLASKFLDGDIEKSWEKLPEQQKIALQGSLTSFADIATKIHSGEGLNVTETRDNCRAIAEEVKAGRCMNLLENVKGHHNYTYVHSLKVASYLGVAGKAIGITGEDLVTLTTGGLLHDVGKIATPQEILNCPNKLEDSEWLEMKAHVTHTQRILSETSDVSDAIRIIAEQHHEKIDGTGYPLGLKGEELSDLARIATISDIFSALTDERSYKPAFSYEKSFEILESMDGAIDMHLLSIFKEAIYKEIPDPLQNNQADEIMKDLKKKIN